MITARLRGFPTGEWMDPARVREALAGSAEQRLPFGRF
jgi:hypothetical protein